MRLIGLAVVLSLTLVSLAAGAQPGGQIYRIGLLSEGAHPLFRPLAVALREFGWIEGKTLKFERRSADKGDQLPSLAAELVRLKVDLILTNGTRAARAAKEATTAIPIVFNLAEDPVANGLVATWRGRVGTSRGLSLASTTRRPWKS
jgi:putative ABC transport system substrate-binding protein